MKKCISFVAVIMTLVFSLTACGQDTESNVVSQSTDSNVQPISENTMPITDEKITLTAMITRYPDMSLPFEELPEVKAFEEETNIHIEWIEIPAQSRLERINLAFSGGELPDIFFGTQIPYDVILRNASEGSIIPLNDLIENYAPNLKKRFEERPDLYENMLFPDGNIYGIPKVDEKPLQSNPDNLFINKKWLDQVGLPVPTTVEEFKEALMAFKNSDLNGNGQNDEIPFSFVMGTNAAPATGIHSLFGSFGVVDTPSAGTHLMVKNGELVYVPITEEYKEGLEYLHELYDEGLIDIEAFSQDSSQYRAKISQNMVGAFMAWQADDMVNPDNLEDYVHVLPLKGTADEPLWYREPGVSGLNIAGSDTGIYFAITSKNQYPAETMRWIDYLTTGDNNLRQYYGTEGEGWKRNEEGQWERLSDPSGAMTANQFSCLLTWGPWTPSMLTYDDIISTQVLPAPAAKKNEREAEYAAYYPEEELPQFKLNLEELEKITRITVDLQTVVDNAEATFITDGVSEDSWKSFVEQVEKVGLQQYMDVYNAAYARVK